MPPTISLNDKLEAYFRAKPDVWIDGMEIAKIAGSYAWRSRCSDLRKRGMDIRNRQQRMTDANGRTWTVSWYMFVSPVEQPEPIQTVGHDLNAGFELR